jgi:hypothetical protein
MAQIMQGWGMSEEQIRKAIAGMSGKSPDPSLVDNFKNDLFFKQKASTTDRYLNNLELQGVDVSELREWVAHQRAGGVRDLPEQLYSPVPNSVGRRWGQYGNDDPSKGFPWGDSSQPFINIPDGTMVMVLPDGRRRIVTDINEIESDLAVYVNGMNNLPEEAIQSSIVQSKISNRPVLLLYNRTNKLDRPGLQGADDMVNVTMGQGFPEYGDAQYFGERSQATLIRLLMSGKVSVVTGHSQGVIISGNAINFVGQNRPELISQLEFAGFGGAHAIDNIVDSRVRMASYYTNRWDLASKGAPVLTQFDGLPSFRYRDGEERSRGFYVNSDMSPDIWSLKNPLKAHNMANYESSVKLFWSQYYGRDIR